MLNIAHVYELPIGPGKRFLNHAGQTMKNLVGGWIFSGVYTYHSGTPLQIFCGANSPHGTPLRYSATDRCNINPGSFSANWNGYYTGNAIFNVNKFSDPGAWSLGNAAPLYSALRNPFESDESIGFAKKFFFGERVSAELRMEYYNVLNRMRVCGGLNNFNQTNNQMNSGVPFGFSEFGGQPGGGWCGLPRQHAKTRAGIPPNKVLT